MPCAYSCRDLDVFNHFKWLVSFSNNVIGLSSDLFRSAGTLPWPCLRRVSCIWLEARIPYLVATAWFVPWAFPSHTKSALYRYIKTYKADQVVQLGSKLLRIAPTSPPPPILYWSQRHCWACQPILFYLLIGSQTTHSNIVKPNCNRSARRPQTMSLLLSGLLDILNSSLGWLILFWLNLSAIWLQHTTNYRNSPNIFHEERYPIRWDIGRLSPLMPYLALKRLVSWFNWGIVYSFWRQSYTLIKRFICK